MSDVGLSADLALDIRSALEQVARLERSLDAAAHVTVIADDTKQVTGAIDAAVTAADTAVTVTGEANELTGDVTSAIDAADSAVTVTGDASELTGDVTGAVDAGDSHVEVTGDASQVTGAVTSAVDDADTAVTITGDAADVTGSIDAAVAAADHTVQIDADTRGLDAATRQSDQLTESVGGAALGAGLLSDNLGKIGAAVSIGGILAATNAASDLNESQSKANVVFGEGVTVINQYADAADKAAGLSKQAALEAEATFGNLFLALGSTRQEATRLAPAVVQLGADLASFNNLGVDDTLEKLRSGLVGEIEPLRSLGVSFTAAQVEAKAMSLGLADANGQVSEGAKIQARWALILEQTGTAQGDFARTSGGLANQQRILTAEIHNAVTEIGAAFLPTMLQLVATARDAIPDIVRLAEAVGPLLAKSVASLIPVVSGALSILTPLGAVASTIANVLDLIPGPVLQAVGAFLALRAATSLLGSPLAKVLGIIGQFVLPTKAVTGAFEEGAAASVGFGGGLSGLVAAINPVTAALAVGAIAFTIWSNKQAQAKKEQAEFNAQQAGFAAALNGSSDAVSEITDNLTKLVQEQSKLITPFGKLPVTAILNQAGLSVENFTAALAAGNGAIEAYVANLQKGSDADKLAAKGIQDLADGYRTGAKAQIDAGVAAGTYTAQQAKAAEQQTRNTDGTKNYVAAQELLAVQFPATTDTIVQQTQAAKDQADALAELSSTAPAVVELMTALGDKTGNTQLDFARLAEATDKAGLSQKQLDAISQELGVSNGPEFQANLQRVADTINNVASAGTSALPTLEDLVGDFKGFSLTKFRDELKLGIQSITDFNNNLLIISTFGGPRLAAAAAQLGPQFAGTIAKGIKDGKPEVIAQLESMLGQFEAAGGNTQALLTNQIGPNLAIATGQIGANVTAEFTNTMNLSDHTSAEGDAAVAVMSGKDQAMSQAAATVGATGTLAYAQSFHPEAVTTARGDASVSIMSSKAAAMGDAGAAAGGAGTSGFSRGVAPIPDIGRAAASGAVGAVSGQTKSASSAGFSVGSALAGGVSAGIDAHAQEAADKASQLVIRAKHAADQAARVGSPSKLFAELGRDIAAGVALGISNGTDDVVAEVRAMIARAHTAAVASPVSTATVAGFVTAAARSASLSTVQAAAGQIINLAPGAVQVNVPPGTSATQAQALGINAGKGFLRAVQQQNIRAFARSV